MRNRERFINFYTLGSGIVLLLGALADPPQGWWRILLYVVIPITLIITCIWRTISGHGR